MADQDKTGELAKSDLRASHEDRDRIAEMLRVAAGDGRLTAEELDERLEAALTARTYGELALLVTDLPTAAHGVAVPAVSTKDLVKIDCHSGTSRRAGQWVVPKRIEAKVTSGHILLDFSQAQIPQRTLRIDTEVRSGNLTIITRPGIMTDTDDVAVHSGHIKIKHPWRADMPEVLRIEIAGRVRSGNITVRGPYRTFWQWLIRQPRPFESARAR